MKKITIAFFSNEGIGLHTWAPLITMAKGRGHKTIFCSNPSTEADVGFYCDDSSAPGNQALTVVSINGLDQDHVVRPDYHRFFQKEGWGNFDLGILPGPRWMGGWIRARQMPGVSPRFGVHEVGWPKSDPLFALGDPAKLRLLSRHERRVLYAPQTEQDGKQTQVLNALRNLGTRLNIKHWETYDDISNFPWLLNESYFRNLTNENDSAAIEKSWVKVMDPRSNFIDALKCTDLLITDQSSTLYEAMLCGIPSITVLGWKHACGNCTGPQPSPDICVASTVTDLGDAVEMIFQDYSSWVRLAMHKRARNFVNLGAAAAATLDLVESALQSI